MRKNNTDVAASKKKTASHEDGIELHKRRFIYFFIFTPGWVKVQSAKEKPRKEAEPTATPRYATRVRAVKVWFWLMGRPWLYFFCCSEFYWASAQFVMAQPRVVMQRMLNRIQ